MKALRRFTVRAHLPQRLNALGELSTNLRWSWHPPTQALFEEIDPLLWVDLERDPIALLGAVGPSRLEALATNEDFVSRLDQLAADLRDYMDAAAVVPEAAAQRIAPADGYRVLLDGVRSQ